MSRVWRFFFQARGRYTTTRGRIEYALYRHSTRYQRWYRAALYNHAEMTR